MATATTSQTHTKEKEALAGVTLDSPPGEVHSILSWQSEHMPEYFRRAYPDATSLQLRNRVLAELMDLILSGQLKARSGRLPSESRVVDLISERLPETISRTPVREALAILVRDGFVHQYPQKGFDVVKVSADEALEVLSLCGEVEGLAIERLIATDGPPDLKLLTEAQDTLAEAMQNNDRNSWMLGDTAFHVGLALSAGFKDALRSVGRWRQKVHLYSLSLTHLDAATLQDTTVNMMEAAMREHAEILAAITNKSERAVELHAQHLERTAVWLGLAKAFKPSKDLGQMSDDALKAELVRRGYTVPPLSDAVSSEPIIRVYQAGSTRHSAIIHAPNEVGAAVGAVISGKHKHDVTKRNVALKVERSSDPKRIGKAIAHLQAQGNLRKELRVPHYDLSKAVELAKKRGAKLTIKNLKGSQSRRVR